MKKQDLLIAGTGGQGIILASNLLSEAALASGYDVKKTDTLGMAQRGGSVVSHIRFADRVFSPLVKQGEADIIIAFEKLEAARWSPYLKADGLIIINDLKLPPLSVSLGDERYPDSAELMEIIRERSDNVHLIDGSNRAKELGNARLLNTLLLGYASLFLPLKSLTIKEAIARHLPAKLRQLNLDAFEEGRKEAPLKMPVG